MIVLSNEYECCGCTACQSVCPNDAITMAADREGFKYPHINQDLCVNCHICEKTCPYINRIHPSIDYEKCFVGINTNKRERMLSSSGGMFPLFAKWIIDAGGIVFGAAFDAEWCVYHKSAEDLEVLNDLVGSKYMQSDLGHTYKYVKGRLKEGRKVLMVGSTCQINGLKNYLGKEYEKLYCIDFICLGVPSAKIWKDYLEVFFNDYKIEYINFKDKSLGWHKFSLRIKGKDKEFVRAGKQTYFLGGYFKHLYTRPSCSHCVYKTGNRCSDITLSDCWGGENFAAEMDDNKGMSAIICHSSKGISMFNSVRKEILSKEIRLSDILKKNPGYICSSEVSPQRKKFWTEYDSISKKELFEKYCSPKRSSSIRKLLGRINRKYVSTNAYQNSRIEVTKFDMGIPYGLYGVNLGSTYAKYAFGTLNEEDKWWGDFSLSGQSLQIDFEILRSYVDRININANVFIGIGACVFFFEGAENFLYYSILDKEHNPYYSKQGMNRNKYPIFDNPKTVVKNIIKSAKGIKKYESIYDIYGCESLEERSSIESLKNLVSAWLRLFGIDDLKHKDIPNKVKPIYENNIQYLRKIIECCINNDLNPIIYIPPFSDRLNKNFSEEFENGVILNAIKKANEGYNVPFYNYQYNEEFQSAYDLFLDGGFRLNRKGSVKFLSIFNEDLGHDGICMKSKNDGGEK